MTKRTPPTRIRETKTISQALADSSALTVSDDVLEEIRQLRARVAIVLQKAETATRMFAA